MTVWVLNVPPWPYDKCIMIIHGLTRRLSDDHSIKSGMNGWWVCIISIVITSISWYIEVSSYPHVKDEGAGYISALSIEPVWGYMCGLCSNNFQILPITYSRQCLTIRFHCKHTLKCYIHDLNSIKTVSLWCVNADILDRQTVFTCKHWGETWLNAA